MGSKKTNSFHVIGLAIRTSNAGGQVASDIPALWNKFMSEKTLEQIPNKLSSNIYCVYTEYEGDHNHPYTTLLGCQVANLDSVPEGMTGKTIEGGNYEQITVKGNLMEGLVWNAWENIWQSDLDRVYSADYEIYREGAPNPQDAEVDILVAVKG